MNRIALVQPPAARRYEFAATYGMPFGLKPGEYTLYILPKRLDPMFRTHYPAMEPVTMAITVTERPLAQEFRVDL